MKNRFLEKIKCLFGFHNFTKYMGAQRAGNGKFLQKLKCVKCGKIIDKYI